MKRNIEKALAFLLIFLLIGAWLTGVVEMFKEAPIATGALFITFSLCLGEEKLRSAGLLVIFFLPPAIGITKLMETFVTPLFKAAGLI